jgi:hypothetical protein
MQMWKPVMTLLEMKQFIGLMLVTGIVQKPGLKMYWTEDPVFETPVFSKTMARNRFESIMSFLHFSDSSQYENSTDRLYKIRPYLKNWQTSLHQFIHQKKNYLWMRACLLGEAGCVFEFIILGK